MILCVFEGKRREPLWFDAISRLFFNGEALLYSIVGSTFHSLYKELKDNEWDLVGALKDRERKRGDSTLQKYNSSDFSEIYLFFDYDPQDKHNDLIYLNNELEEMLDYFVNETENGKMFVSYPMIEALRYTKKLPDIDFYKYTVPLKRCCDFKSISADFSFYKNDDFIINDSSDTRNNWKMLIQQNACKANYIISGNNALPSDKSIISQQNILKVQLEKYIGTEQKCVSILCSFPLFLYDYLK